MYSCGGSKINGQLSVSSDITDSKQRGVFVTEYTTLTNPYRINDTLSINFKSAWLEHVWRADGSNGEKAKIMERGYQLIVITNESSLKGYDDTWKIGLNGDAYFRLAARDAIMTDFETLPKASTFEWDVQNGHSLSRNEKKTIIGKFVLTAK
jgi:hypothetical protein